MMEKIGLIINPYAQKNKKLDEDLSKSYYNNESIPVEVRLLSPSRNMADIIKEFYDKSVDHIAVSGGDGTIHYAITSILNTYRDKNLPKILVLPGGTMDNISQSLNQNGTAQNIFKSFLTQLNDFHKIETCRRDTIKIGDNYCFLFGTGMVTNFLNEAYAGGNKGNLKNIKVISKAIIHAIFKQKTSHLFKGLVGKFETDETVIPLKEVTAILAGTVEEIGMGFKTLSKANKKDASFHAIITGITPGKIVRSIWSIRKGKEIEDSKHFDCLTNRLIINSDGMIPYTMDGDLYEAEKCLVVETGPPVEFIVVSQ